MKATTAARKLEPGRAYALRRQSDGKFAGIWGWALEWENEINHICVTFLKSNLGPARADDIHVRLFERLTGPAAKANGQFCQLVPWDTPCAKMGKTQVIYNHEVKNKLLHKFAKRRRTLPRCPARVSVGQLKLDGVDA